MQQRDFSVTTGFILLATSFFIENIINNTQRAQTWVVNNKLYDSCQEGELEENLTAVMGSFFYAYRQIILLLCVFAFLLPPVFNAYHTIVKESQNNANNVIIVVTRLIIPR